MAPEFRFNWIIGTHGFQENINLPREVLNCYTYANQHTVSAPATLTPTHNLRPKEEVNYRSQHLGQEIKQAAKELKQEFKKWCKSMRKTDNLLLLHTTSMSGYLSTLRMIEIP